MKMLPLYCYPEGKGSKFLRNIGNVASTSTLFPQGLWLPLPARCLQDVISV